MSAGASTVTALSITPVKATRLHCVQSIALERAGARGDRRFFVVDSAGRMVNSKRLGPLQTVVAEFDEASRRLTLTFPDGECVEEVVDGGPPFAARFYSDVRDVRLLEGPCSDALSRHVGQPVRVVEGGSAVDRGLDGAVSLISRASLDRLSQEAGVEQVDARRFRMLIEIDGAGAHEEDDWIGRTVRVGPALVRFEGNVGRCLITSRHPDTAEIDLPTLDVLRDYRGEVPCSEPLPFGVYGRVLEEGPVSIGDAVELVE